MRILIHILIASVFLSSCAKKEHLVSTDPEVEYEFLVAGHVYGSPTSPTLGIYPPFKERFGEIKAEYDLDFTVYTGDVVLSNNNLEQWDSVMSDMNSLSEEYHIAPGNHDRGPVFTSLFGSPYYYSFQHFSDLFIILSPNDWNIEGAQKEFLITTLEENNEADNIFIFCHELIWWSPDSIFQNIGINFEPHYPGSTNYWTEIDSLLKSIDKPVYLFSGDIGGSPVASPYAYYENENIYFVASGMGGSTDSNYLIIQKLINGDLVLKLQAVEGEPNRFGDIRDYEIP